jgi:hypothetical protein
MLPSPSQQQHTHKWCKCLFPSSFSPRPKKLTRQRATQKKGKYKREREKLLYIQAQEIGRRREEKKRAALILYLYYIDAKTVEREPLFSCLYVFFFSFFAHKMGPRRGEEEAAAAPHQQSF